MLALGCYTYATLFRFGVNFRDVGSKKYKKYRNIMGATGWIYFVPYQLDIEKALQALRDEVFRTGKYEYHFG